MVAANDAARKALEAGIKALAEQANAAYATAQVRIAHRGFRFALLRLCCVSTAAAAAAVLLLLLLQLLLWQFPLLCRYTRSMPVAHVPTLCISAQRP